MSNDRRATTSRAAGPGPAGTGRTARAVKRIVLASGNPAKARATLHGFRRAFPDDEFELTTVSVPSGVARQPSSDEETLRGALGRAAAAAERRPDADFWVGIEGGVEPHALGLASYAWIVVRSRTLEGCGRTGAFLLPEPIAARVLAGAELAEACGAVLGPGRPGRAGGAVALLTHGAMDRAELYEHGVLLALIPFRNPGLYGARPRE